MSKFSCIITLAMVFTLLSCNRDIVYSDYIDLSHDHWDTTDTIEFHLSKMDRKTYVTPKVMVRSSDIYKYQTINMLVELSVASVNPPHKTKVVSIDTLSVRLFDKKGKNTGTGLIHTETSFVMPQIELDTLDYTYRVTHLMHENPISGISSIGIQITE